MIKKTKELYKLLLIFPFSFVYYPMLSFVSIIGGIIGIKRYKELKTSGREW